MSTENVQLAIAAIGTLLLAFEVYDRRVERQLRSKTTQDAKKVADRLNVLRFHNDGALGLLKAYARGNGLPKNQRSRLHNFDASILDVELALKILSKVVKDEEPYPGFVKRELEALADEKIGVRALVDDVVRKIYAGEPVGNPAEVQRLVEQIDKLNCKIDTAEKSLLGAR